ncbi:MAG: FecR family protein, partial [Myxococcales bacterium]|nr:FecR family protein [Myxococcales bacterium]
HEGVEPSVVNEGAVLESAADEHVRVRLAAATLELGPASRARLVRATAAEIDVELSAGRIDVEFHPTLAGAGLSVRTDEATVRVVGTRFVVERDASGTRVAVLEGRVRVEQLNGGSSVLLAAGDEHRVTASGRSTEGDGSTERKPEVPAASSVPPPNGDNVPEQRARAHNQRADAHERAGRWRAAADAYRRAIRESPAGAEGQAARFALARLLERRLGDVQGARREYRRYLERFPQGPNAPQVREALCRLEGRCPEEPLP